MGCELCQMENRENNDIRFTRDGVRPIKEYSRNRQFAEENNLDKDSYYNLLEERLNEKYSIPEKTLDELRERINNENNPLSSNNGDLKNSKKNEYIINTLNIYSNNTIKFGSGDKKKNDSNKADDNFSNFYNRDKEKENRLENGSTYRKNKNRSMEKIRPSKDDLRFNIEKAREKGNSRKKRYLEDKDKESNNKNNSITDNENDNKENKPENENDKSETKKNKHKHRHNHSQEQCQHHHHHHHHHRHKHKTKKDVEQNDENEDGGNNEKSENELQEEKRAERTEKSRDKRSKKKDRNDTDDEMDKREKKDRKNKKKNTKKSNESNDIDKDNDDNNNDKDNDTDNNNDNNDDDNKENISNNNITKKNSELDSDKNISFNNNKDEKDDLYSDKNSKDESASDFEKILKNNKNNDESNAKEKNVENNNNLENDNSEEGQGEGIRYTYTKQMSKNTEKINILLQQIRHPKIDKILKDAPNRSKTTLQKLKEYLKKNSKNLSLVEKAWLDFKWVAQNIEYDFAGVNDYNYDISPEATFNRGKSICSGYAGLYKDIGDYLGLTIERIGGFSKGFNFNLGETIDDSEKHEWNAVQIDGDWYFIESTWGAGFSSDQKKFTKKFTPYYFFTPPQEFVRGHLPFEPKWQLLPKTKKVSQQTFMEFAPLKSDFFTLGFNKIDPDYTFNDVKEKGKITLYFEKEKSSKKKLAVMGKLYSLQNDQEIPNSILEIPKKDCFEVNYLINKKGEYKLKIFGNDGSVKEYNELCTLKLTTVKDSSKPLAFPATTTLYHNSDIEIIQPDNGILYEGDKINFEFKATTFDQLFIGISSEKGANFTEMNKKKNVFKEEDVLIYGKKILISCRGEKENSYNSIMEYNVLSNPKNKVKITFPQVFAGPKNRLIEPICDTLKKGKKVFFKIRSNLINEMSVHDGEQFNKLNKDDDVFSGEVKVTGKGEVKIVYKKDDNGSYGVLYSYKVN